MIDSTFLFVCFLTLYLKLTSSQKQYAVAYFGKYLCCVTLPWRNGSLSSKGWGPGPVELLCHSVFSPLVDMKWKNSLEDLNFS